ncbi:MAG: transcriptional regulator [Gammaproteobacteria bacterium]|nr:transcriptional regulator [Gammaproteobacteria bacterium]MBU1444214.1 transcriptional regulator [Gammaproteobacteria bacterium]MBU2286288.1 transcriptional regulator [Gammaproteobacteria bacterium]MBU2410018.1 transcriptional regulator [Gammaproteobacteria bacterium]
MEVHAIRDEASYRSALQRVSVLVDLDPAPDTAEGEVLEILGTLIEVYEAKRYAMAPPDPIDAIRFHMEQSGLKPADLVPYIGPTNRVYEILAGRRPLTMPMIRRLLTLGIPASSLVGQPEPVAA